MMNTDSGFRRQTIDLENALEASEKARQAAEDANALKSAFLANMSHEIRTPLGVIMGFSELLSDPELDPAERSECIGVIHRNGEHLSRLIDDILDLSKVEAGKIEIEMVPVDVRAEVVDVLSNLQSGAFEKRIDLNVDFDDRMPGTIQTDLTRFKQIFSNLAGNALKFTESGEVRISVSIVGAISGAECICIRVADSGVGISEEGREHLFEPFARGDRSTNRRINGTGLGLALSRKIARVLGGDIVLVESTLGVGSVFELTLPAKGASESCVDLSRVEMVMAQTGSLGDAPLSGLRVLVAEDTPDNQELMKRVLGRRGAGVSIVGDGEQAVEAVMTGNYDLVLMDIQMPRIDGYEATRRLRRLGFQKPIIALTAHAMKEERQRCLDAGCNDHLSKPVPPDLLAETILRHTPFGTGVAAAN